MLRYQLIADVRTGELRAVEALLRGHHPVHGVVPPDEFARLARTPA